MIGSSAYWILPSGEIIDIGSKHIEYIIKHPAIFNTTQNEIISLYKKYDEIMPCENMARREIILDLLEQGFIRIREYRNFWSLSLHKLDKKSKSSLSKWAELALTIPNSGKYADCIIQTAIDNKKHHCSVQQLYSQTY